MKLYMEESKIAKPLTAFSFERSNVVGRSPAMLF